VGTSTDLIAQHVEYVQQDRIALPCATFDTCCFLPLPSQVGRVGSSTDLIVQHVE
jgi:hypothetical protein